jgi:hypothetical protein
VKKCLRKWLEIDHGAEFPALPFLHETIDQISSDGEVTEDELDRLAIAIERVLPKDIRLDVAAKRRRAREIRRSEEREKRRQQTIAARMQRRATRDAERIRAGVLYRSDFPVRGAMRFAERREACDRLVEDDVVTLEREPQNTHDENAILVLADGDCELGYVPREEASVIARLMDGGADVRATVRRLWETPEGKIVPILLVIVRRGDADSAAQPVAGGAKHRQTRVRIRNKDATPVRQGSGCASAVVCCLLLLLVLIGASIR